MRHIRLMRQISGTDEFIAAIEPARAELATRMKTTQSAFENKTSTYDLMVLGSSLLDNKIRNLSDDCSQYDRNNPGRPVYLLVFPDGKISNLLRTKMEDKPTMAASLVKRIEALGPEHPLAVHIASINQGIANLNEAITNNQLAIEQFKSVSTLENIAKLALIKQYELNYLDASKKFGKKYADHFFPKLTSSSGGNNGDSNEEKK
jgi:hypothetical protein